MLAALLSVLLSPALAQGLREAPPPALPRPLIPARAVQELATAEPARVEQVLAALKAEPPSVQKSVLGQARRLVADRVEAGAAGYRRVAGEGDFGRRFDVYDDMLRSLKLQGFF